jgi:ADP-heptose:LPS heptosyltransferase
MRSDRALLVAAGGGIGDTLLAGVVARALRTRFAAVDAIVLPAHIALAARMPMLAESTPLGARLAHRYDAAVVTWATMGTALLPWRARIPVRVGQARRLYSGLFTERVVVRSERGDHQSPWTDILLDYARAIDCTTDDTIPSFVPTEVDRADADTLLRVHDVGGAFYLLHATRGLSAQHARWPTVGFAALARELVRRDAIGAFGALAARARAVLAMDSGPMHVAAAVGAPTVGIFALQSDEPDRWAPQGRRVAVVRPTYPCPPGHRKETCPNFACVRELDTAGILAALAGLLAPPGEP